MTQVRSRMLIGAVAGAVVGALLGLLVHEVFDVGSTPTGYEIVGGAAGLLLGAIIGAFYGSLSAVSRTSHLRTPEGPASRHRTSDRHER
jgi:gas vesicle protein